MIDFQSVRLTGAANFMRVRVLWKDGRFKAYDKTGLVLNVKSKEPEIQPRKWNMHWIAETERGNILMKSKCLTCGGWRNVTKINAEALWES